MDSPRLQQSLRSNKTANNSNTDHTQPQKMESEMKLPADDKKAKVLYPTIFSLFFDLMSFTLILPLLPSILHHYKETDKSGLFSTFSKQTEKLATFLGAPGGVQSETVLMGGLLGSLFCVLQFVSAPIIGAMSDMFGRRVALLGCMLGICISHLIWMTAGNFPMFILARVIGGLARANVSICTTIVADDCPPALRPKGMAMIGIAFSIGFTVGPCVGAYFAHAGDLYTPALVSLLLSVLSATIIYFFVEETLAVEDRKPTTHFPNVISFIWPPFLFNFKAVSVGAKLRKLGFVYFIYIFFYSGLEFTLTFLTHTKFNFTPTDQGKMFTYIGITMALLQGTVTRRLTPEMETSAAMLGMLITIPAFVTIGFSQDSVQLAFGLFCFSIGSATVGPCLTSILASMVSKPNEKGVALGIFRSLGALARSFGPLFASFIFWGLGSTYAYVIGAIFLLVPLVLLKFATSTNKED